jgi:hypothetical protein
MPHFHGNEPAAKSRRLPRVRPWIWPMVLAGMSLFGLLSALIGHGGARRELSWIALSFPLLILAIHLRRA